jgi:hypothetical protein
MEDLKKFDGSIEGAARIAGAEGGGIDWHQISENIGTLQEHLKRDGETLKQLNDRSEGFEEQVLQLAEGDPVRDQVVKQWQELKNLIRVFEADRKEIEDLIQGMMHIDFSGSALQRNPEETVQ